MPNYEKVVLIVLKSVNENTDLFVIKVEKKYQILRYYHSAHSLV